MMDEQPLQMGFANFEEWNRFNQRFPEYVQRYGSIDAMRGTVFQRRAVGARVDRVIFGLGWSAFEDFQQINLLCGNGYGIGAMQILRGMYERVVVAAYLSRHPQDVDDFLDFDYVQRRKGLNNLRRLYQGNDLDRVVSPDRQREIEDEYQNAKRDGRFTEVLCDVCNKVRDTISWTRLSMPDLARRGGRELDIFLFPIYIKPTLLSHASLYSLMARMRDNPDGGFSFDAEGQRAQVEPALQHAHFLLVHMFGTQNDHFHLGADDQLQALLDDYRACWRHEPPTDAEPVETF
ncbi:MAG TPA: DUF5677 domain-containing protein [Pyrinomonadaceae bacterium]|nr:DUF5677 domain-containing protein [Pyrinomonadaceae bacterium]